MRAIAFLALRYLRSRRKHRGFGSATLSLVGLLVGVMALNVVLAVMNGFQGTYIDALVEVSSSHVRWTPDRAPDNQTLAALTRRPEVTSLLEQTESQTLISSDAGRQRGALLRGLPTNALTIDRGLAEHLKLEGHLPADGEVALGSALAFVLGVDIGSTVQLTALSGPGFSLLSPEVLNYRVTGIFSTGYYEMDASWVIGDLGDTLVHFAGVSDHFWSIKLRQPEDASWAIPLLAQSVGLPVEEFRSWKEFNQAFFRALQTEKTSMMLVVGLIFLVVGSNIYWSQKRAVCEHQEDIALLQATGTSRSALRWVFAAEGLLVGSLAAVVGTLAGAGLSAMVGSFGLFSREAFFVPDLPARMQLADVLWIAGGAVVAGAWAAWAASGQVLKIPVGEALKHT